MSDRADRIATAVVSIVCNCLQEALQYSPPTPGARDKAHAAVADYLRDEISSIEQAARGERRLAD
jgi:hypothetical protein